MIYRLFDLNIRINERFEDTKLRLQPFLTHQEEIPDIVIAINDEELENEEKIDPGRDMPYHEMMSIMRHIAEEIPDFDGMFIHSAIVSVDDEGYMLLGKSGAGKSTQAGLWKKYFGEKCEIINGDKPVIRFFEDGIYAYGSPWCGEQGWYVNKKVCLKAACFINKSDTNSITRQATAVTFSKIHSQTVVPKRADRRVKHYELLDELLGGIEFYELYATLSEEAVKKAYGEMSKNGKE